MFKIGEFSKLTQISIRMLRYYEETGILKPAQIDKFTGYRPLAKPKRQVQNGRAEPTDRSQGPLE